MVPSDHWSKKDLVARSLAWRQPAPISIRMNELRTDVQLRSSECKFVHDAPLMLQGYICSFSDVANGSTRRYKRRVWNTWFLQNETGKYYKSVLASPPTPDSDGPRLTLTSEVIDLRWLKGVRTLIGWWILSRFVSLRLDLSYPGFAIAAGWYSRNL